MAALVALCVYAPALRYGFVWDDRTLIVEDVRLRSISALVPAITGDFFSASSDVAPYGYFRPTVTLSYAWDLWIWGERAIGFHLTNIVAHAVVSAGVCALGTSLGMRPVAALLAGLLFAVHPIHLESVAWISGRTDVFAALLLLPYMFLVDARSTRAAMIGGVALAAALCAKELAIVGPCIAWLCKPACRRPRTLWIAGVVIGAYALLRLGVIPVRPSPGPPHGAWNHVTSALSALPAYLGMAVPWSQSPYLQWPPASGLLDPRTIFGLASLTAAGALAVALPGVGPLLASAFVSLVPALNFIRVAAPNDMGFPTAERFAYLPSLFFALGIARALPLESRRGVAFASVLVVGFAGLTTARLPMWRDDLSLFTAAHAQSPTATLVASQLAIALRHEGRDEEALACVRETMMALRSRGEEVPTTLFTTLVNLMVEQGNLEEAEQLLRERIQSGDDSSILLYNLGVVRELRGDDLLARQSFETAVKARPDFVVAWMAKGVIELRQHDTASAVRSFRQVTKINPRHADGFHMLGLALNQRGKTAAAVAALLRSADLDPTGVESRLDAAILLRELNPLKADALVEEAIFIQPTNARALSLREAMHAAR